MTESQIIPAIQPIPETKLSIFETTPPEVADAVSTWLGDKAKTSVRAYIQDTEVFAEFCNVDTPQDAISQFLKCNQYTAYTIGMKYRAWLISNGWHPATINRRLSSLRSLVHLAKKTGHVTFDLDIPNVRGESYKDTSGPGIDGFNKLIETALLRNDAIGSRNVALLRLARDLALRRSELSELKLEHLDIERKTISILGKGKLERQILSVPKETIEYIIRWLNDRGSENGALFCSFSQKKMKPEMHMNSGSINRIFKGIGAVAGVKRSNAHGMRHLGITEAIEATNGNVADCQEYSRHKDVRTLMRYFDNKANKQGEIASLVARNPKNLTNENKSNVASDPPTPKP